MDPDGTEWYCMTTIEGDTTFAVVVRRLSNDPCKRDCRDVSKNEWMGFGKHRKDMVSTLLKDFVSWCLTRVDGRGGEVELYVYREVNWER